MPGDTEEPEARDGAGGSLGQTPPGRGLRGRQRQGRQPDLFLSYRRADSSGYAGWLFDHLDSALRGRRVYMDVVSIPPGSRFAQRVRAALASTRIMLALIGPNWTDSRDAQGNRRLDDPEDLVRLELLWARQLDKPIVPVLIGGASLPEADDLPGDLRFLAGLTPVSLGDGTWSQDVATLIGHLRLATRSRWPQARKLALAAGIAVVVAAGVVAALLSRPSTPASVTLGPVIAEVAPAGFFAVSTPCARFDLPVGSVYGASGGIGGCFISGDMRPAPALHPNGLAFNIEPAPPPSSSVAAAVRAYRKQSSDHWASQQSVTFGGRPAVELKGTFSDARDVAAVAIFTDVPDRKDGGGTVFWFLSGYYVSSAYYQQELQAVLASWQWVSTS